jgi:Ricin-type beta-trefoil lectin domain
LTPVEVELLTRRFIAVALLSAAVSGLFVGMGIGVFFSPKPPQATSAVGTLGPAPPAETPDGTPSETPSDTGTAPVGPPRGTTYVITNAVNGGAADVAGGGDDDGTPVILFEPHGRDNQRWTVRDAGSGFVTLVSESSGKCLQMRNQSRRQGAIAVISDCDDSDGQRWTFSAKQNGWSLTSGRSGLVLDASDLEIAGNRVMIQKEAEDQARSQVWLFTPVS